MLILLLLLIEIFPPFFLFAVELMNIDSDSGLGRATPPRRAPSPGMGTGSSSRHLPSPSGPGSLPHPSLMSKRRIGGGNGGYDDGASDISSTPSSIMMDYNGKYTRFSSL